ncbi:MAG: aldo/keto reductase [Oscillospiraceae bacterium]|nr:aldo/keto reductase [Oscillospiraceae bacterium]
MAVPMIPLAGTGMQISNVAMGCMRIGQLSLSQLRALTETALENGINFFDHADIYGGGRCETLFGQMLRESPSLREGMILQSKCGIRKGYYDFSRDYLLQSVEGILSRLGVEQLDVLLLHRPDALMEPEEVAEAFDRLSAAGKVRYFGVSNHSAGQMELLQSYLGQKLTVNQLQFGLAHSSLVGSGLSVNNLIPQAQDRDGGVLDWCRLHGVTVQAWSPFQHGMFLGTFLGDQTQFPALNEELGRLAKKYGVAPAAVALGWIARHPARIQTVLGTINPAHLAESCRGADLPLTREEWYGLYRAAGNPVL